MPFRHNQGDDAIHSNRSPWGPGGVLPGLPKAAHGDMKVEVYTHTHTHKHIHVYTQTHTHTHTHTHQRTHAQTIRPSAVGPKRVLSLRAGPLAPPPCSCRGRLTNMAVYSDNPAASRHLQSVTVPCLLGGPAPSSRNQAHALSEPGPGPPLCV